ncbi:MAG: monofunctional biosynthetic peptidoglycan transglycosylase [Ignavibacterium sp.]|nr:MAG: monofunctional biosynthetic peptidoglycan transglycosylase [Ignavibacterium sp.]
MRKKLNRKIALNKISVIFFRILIFLVMLSIFQVLLYKWSDPITTSVMTQRQICSFFSNEKSPVFRWTDYDEISKEFALAVVASEDQNFPTHFGFDFEQINKAIEEREERRRLRGASTITQQVAKNLFLWEGRSFIRKGFEAYYTLLIELLWSKKRILEMYINIAEMGDNIFGIGKASKIYYNKVPIKLTRDESVSISAVLPNPKRYSALNPSRYIKRRQEWILNQMRLLGGATYLDEL